MVKHQLCRTSLTWGCSPGSLDLRMSESDRISKGVCIYLLQKVLAGFDFFGNRTGNRCSNPDFRCRFRAGSGDPARNPDSGWNQSATPNRSCPRARSLASHFEKPENRKGEAREQALRNQRTRSEKPENNNGETREQEMGN